jgi:hypothetical protein
MKLKRKYQARIYIILGNRDINKLRLLYEVDEQQPVPDNDNKGWSVWKEFYEEYAKATTSEERKRAIFTKSMGAEYNDINKDINMYLNANTINNLKRVNISNDIRDLFIYGRIVAYDKDTKTLMSHAGGFNVPFHSKDYYDNMIADSPPNATYYEKIEYYRKRLHVRPTPKVNMFIDDIINVINYPLEGWDFDKDPTEEFYLLQALGLKPDKITDTFYSYVESCGNKPCNSIITNIQPEYILQLKSAGIECISAGHVIHCTPIPLIYRREGIIFIANDTSNGNRPLEITETNFPMSYVSATHVGITSLGLDSNIYTGKDDEYKTMVGNWDKNGLYPQYNENENKNEIIIDYGGTKKLIFETGDVVVYGKKPTFVGGGSKRTKRRRRRRRRKTVRRRNRQRKKIDS